VTCTLILTENLCWMPTSGIFDLVLEELAENVRGENQGLANQLLQGTRERGWGYLDLSDSDNSVYVLLEQVVDQLVQTHKEKGPFNFVGDTSGFPPYMNLLYDLQKMLNEVVSSL